MAYYSGVATQIGYALETTPDTPATVTAFLPLGPDGEKLKQDRDRIESDAIRAGRRVLDANDWAGGNISPGGDVGHELYNAGIGKLLTGMFGTVSSTTGPVNSLYTHTWTAVGEPKPLTVQKGVPDVGGTIRPMTYTAMMVEDWELACAAGEFASIGLTFAGLREIGYRTVSDGVTTSGSAAITSATAVWTQDDVGKPISGTGIPAAATILSVQSATNATLSANATATASSITFTIGIALAAASYLSGLKPFAYHQGSVSIGGSAVSVKKLSVKGKNGLDSNRRFIGTRYRKQPLEAGIHTITGTLDLEFENRGQYDRFIAEGTYACVISFVHQLGETLTLTMNIRHDGDTPVVKGRGIVPYTLPFKCNGTTDALAFNLAYITTDATP
jgi:hypothetical protein